MRRFKNRIAIADVRAGSNAEAAHLRGGRVRDVVAVEICSRQNAVVRRANDDLLEDGVGDAVVDENLVLPRAFAVCLADGVENAFDLGIERIAKFLVAEFEAGLNQRGILFDGDVGVGVDIAEDPAFALGDGLVAKLLDRNLVSPLAERTFGELLNVALVHQRYGLAAGLERLANGITDEALGSEDRDRLDADARVGTNLLLAALEQVFVDELDQSSDIRRCPA